MRIRVGCCHIQKQIALNTAEHHALNEWHVGYVFANAMYGENVCIKPNGGLD
jgi:hypothetical protein